jgi:Zn-dependent peptidase ImmA (M78 family)
LSGEGKKGTTVVRIPKWESELWSYVSSGDGMRCPLQKYRPVMEKGTWCPDEYRGRLNQLLDEKRFNFNSYDFINSESSGVCRLCQLVERLAEAYLKARNALDPPVSTEMVMLFDPQNPVEIRQLKLKAYHGAIWSQQDGWVIQVNDSDAAPTMRFTVLHEAFHILAHCRTTPVFRKRGSVVGSFNEFLADHFAFCTLMPREWIIEKWTEVKDLDRMAEIFVVPKSAMCIRLRQLGLI